MKAIIASIDFSQASLNAARYAADMARKMQAELYLFHVCVIPVPVSEIPVAVGEIDEDIAEAETEIRKLKDNLETKNGVTLKITTEVRGGDFLYELQDFCTAVQPTAVVLGPNGKGAIEMFFFGNSTLKAVSGVAWPLLIIPSDTVFTDIHKIGLACDYQNVATSVPVTKVKELIRLFNAELHVVHVSAVAPGPHPSADPESGVLKTMLNDLNPSYHLMYRPDIDKGIAEFAEQSHLDLLIVIPRKHALPGGIFHKSHTKQLLLNTHVPILSIHE